MNYRHQFHAGNFADALKHALLVRLIRALQRKEGGYLFVDTHSGRGAYDLSLAGEGAAREREPEWPGGIGRLWSRPAEDLGPEIADYVGQVRLFDRAGGNLGSELRDYPGSPELARALARPQDRLSLWEKHPEECAALRARMKPARRISVHEEDGYRAPRAVLPPPERRALVLIDPPFEDIEEPVRIQSAVAEAIERMPAAVVAVWYPLTERTAGVTPDEGLARLGRPVLAAEIHAQQSLPATSMSRLSGCGVAIVNPPWTFEGEAAAIVRGLAEILGNGASSGAVRVTGAA